MLLWQNSRLTMIQTHKKTDVLLLSGCWKLSLITDKKYTTTNTDATSTNDHLNWQMYYILFGQTTLILMSKVTSQHSGCYNRTVEVYKVNYEFKCITECAGPPQGVWVGSRKQFFFLRKVWTKNWNFRMNWVRGVLGYGYFLEQHNLDLSLERHKHISYFMSRTQYACIL